MNPQRPLRSDERGFTLIELLVVILIIGILTAIALPAFLGQRAKAQDTKAKSNARNLVSQMEVCFRNVDGYIGCTAELTAAETGLPIGAGVGCALLVGFVAIGLILLAIKRGRDVAYGFLAGVGALFALFALLTLLGFILIIVVFGICLVVIGQQAASP